MKAYDYLPKNIDQAKQEILALQAMYDKREERINALFMKQRQKLNWKVKETLVQVRSSGRLKQPNCKFYGRTLKSEGKKAKASTRWTKTTYK